MDVSIWKNRVQFCVSAPFKLKVRIKLILMTIARLHGNHYDRLCQQKLLPMYYATNNCESMT